MEAFLIILISFVVMMLAFLGLSAGVLLGRSPIRGSCGGLGTGSCVCTEPCEKRKQAMQRLGLAEPES